MSEQQFFEEDREHLQGQVPKSLLIANIIATIVTIGIVVAFAFIIRYPDENGKTIAEQIFRI